MEFTDLDERIDRSNEGHKGHGPARNRPFVELMKMRREAEANKPLVEGEDVIR